MRPGRNRGTPFRGTRITPPAEESCPRQVAPPWECRPWRRPPLCTRACRSSTPYVCHTTPRRRILPQGMERRTSRGGVAPQDALPGSSSLPAACDPRFCARRGPTALPFPPATPQSPCSPPSAVLWPNLTSRSSSAYGFSSAAPPRQRGKTSQVPASAMVLGPRGAPLTNAARCLRPRPRHSGFKASRGSIAWPAAPQRFASRRMVHGEISLSRDLHPATFHQFAWHTRRQLHQQCRRTENQDGKAQGVRMLPLHAKAWCQATSPPWPHSATIITSQPRSPSTEKPQTSSTSTTTNQNPTRGE